VQQLIRLLLGLSLLVAMTAGSLSHAAEALCADEASVTTLAEIEQSPPSADVGGDKAVHHIHACHGHHSAVASNMVQGALAGEAKAQHIRVASQHLPEAGEQDLLRPPIA
jgi:hypothetical protein